MSDYRSSYQATVDPSFVGRVTICAVEQAMIFKDDGRPEFHDLAEMILGNAAEAVRLVYPVAAKPSIDVDATDGDILSAVQDLWPTIGATVVPPA